MLSFFSPKATDSCKFEKKKKKKKWRLTHLKWTLLILYIQKSLVTVSIK